MVQETAMEESRTRRTRSPTRQTIFRTAWPLASSQVSGTTATERATAASREKSQLKLVGGYEDVRVLGPSGAV